MAGVVAARPVDVQRGFADPVWGTRNNLACEDDVARLIEAYRRCGEPIVFVRHGSHEHAIDRIAICGVGEFATVVRTRDVV